MTSESNMGRIRGSERFTLRDVVVMNIVMSNSVLPTSADLLISQHFVSGIKNT